MKNESSLLIFLLAAKMHAQQIQINFNISNPSTEKNMNDVK